MFMRAKLAGQRLDVDRDEGEGRTWARERRAVISKEVHRNLKDWGGVTEDGESVSSRETTRAAKKKARVLARSSER